MMNPNIVFFATNYLAGELLVLVLIGMMVFIWEFISINIFLEFIKHMSIRKQQN